MVMVDVFGTKLSVGDQVKIIKDDGCFNLKDRVAIVVQSDCVDKIKVSFDDQWQGYFKSYELLKINESNEFKNAEYFRKLQNKPCVEDIAKSKIEFILKTIEGKIIDGYKYEYLSFNFDDINFECFQIIQNILTNELGFNVYGMKTYTTDNKFEFTVDWSEK